MASRDLKPSRRALLGAAVAIPPARCAVAGAEAPPVGFARSPAPADGGEGLAWREALDGLRAAEGALRAFEARTAGAPDEAQDEVEREMDERLEALGPALLRLLGAPVPDLEALAVKIETIVAHEAWSLSEGEECMAALGRDARRLAGGGEERRT